MAQAVHITGKVTSSEDKQPLIGATIKVKGTSVGVITDANGNYSLDVPANQQTLVFSFVGYKTLELDIAGKKVVDATLESSSVGLEEVVVIATPLGIVRQQREVGFAATTVNNTLITEAHTTDVQQALTGKVSGLNITTVNSGVFEDAKINIRGIRSLTGNNQPMFVLDGAPIDLSYLSSIAPDDIQDITILKSAASAALYGPDAVNGVIIITTKKGNADNPSVTLTSSLQATRVAYFPQLQHEFGPYGGEGAPYLDKFGNPLYVPIENQNYGPKFDGSIKPIGIVDEQGHQQSGPYSNLHWKDKINFWNTGMTWQNGFSLSAKDYFFSINNASVQGLMPSDLNNRTTVHFTSGKEYKNLSVNYNVNYTRNDWDIVNEADIQNLVTGAYGGSVLVNVLQVGDNVPLLSYKDLNSEWGKYDNYFCEYAQNPYWLIANLRQKGTSDNLIGTLDFSYKFAKWLTANIKLGSTVTFQDFQNTDGPIQVSDYTLYVLHRYPVDYHNQPGKEFDDSRITSRVNFDGFLSGEFNLSDLTIKYIAGSTVRSNYFKDVAVGGNNLTINGLNNVSVRSGDANVPTGTSNNWNSTVRSGLVSAYANLSFGFRRYLYLELTGRNDWDSRLLPNNRSFFYPGANLSLVVSDILPGLKSNNISFLKVFTALNKSGNVNLNPYDVQATYGPNLGFPYGSNVGYTHNTVIPSPNLKPEFVSTFEVGTEIRVIKDRISFSGTYFNQNNTNQILEVSQSWTTGYPAGLANAASFRNYGLEMELGFTPLVKLGPVAINFRMNATYNDNEITETQGNTPVVLTGNNNFIQQATGYPTVNAIAVPGKPAFRFQLSDYNRDPNGRVIVGDNGFPTVSSGLIMKGRTLPVWVLGYTPTIIWGNLSLYMTWDYKTGNDYYAGLGADLDFSGLSARSAQFNRQRFVYPNSVYLQNGQYVKNTDRLTLDGNYNFWSSTVNTQSATNYFCSASAIRLRELNISYNVPTPWLHKTSDVIKKISVSLVGRNLLMFLPKSNQWGDPEFNYTSSGNTAGISSGFETPASRYYGGTLTIQL